MKTTTSFQRLRSLCIGVRSAAVIMAPLLVLGLGAQAGLAQSSPPPAAGEPGGPVLGLTTQELRAWLDGREQFDRNFHVSSGLGTPEFNGNSCRACHSDPAMGGAGPLEVNVSRFAHDNAGGGPYMDLPGGQILGKLRPPPLGTRENFPIEADVFEQRQTPSLLGAGLIESISDAAILANEDPTDADGDGIFGIARIRIVEGQPEVGRFGWKAQLPLLLDFTRDGMGNELGITTLDDGRGFAITTDSDTVADPELGETEVNLVAFFMRNLAQPVRDGGAGTFKVDRGEYLFSQLRCDRCHIPELQGANGPVALYSDLLLHDVMGPGFRGMSEDGAPSGMYRTPPLWGIEDTAPYMHDGRAETLQEAILMHSGEAEMSTQAYLLLHDRQKANVLAFLQDL